MVDNDVYILLSIARNIPQQPRKTMIIATHSICNNTNHLYIAANSSLLHATTHRNYIFLKNKNIFLLKVLQFTKKAFIFASAKQNQHMTP